MQTRSTTGVLARKEYAEKKPKKRNSKSTTEQSSSVASESNKDTMGPYAASEAIITKMREMTAASERQEKEKEAEKIAEELRKKKKKAELALIAEEEEKSASKATQAKKNTEKRKRQTPPGVDTVRGRTTSATGSAKEKIARLAAHGRAVAAAGTMVSMKKIYNIKYSTTLCFKVVASAAAGRLTPTSGSRTSKSPTPVPLANFEDIGDFLDTSSGEDEEVVTNAKISKLCFFFSNKKIFN